ncbi:ABC transporter ATP-binding protein [Phreatobacter sp. AB_2022a]|uniref:ABC transporter ATP-binding protein n=1 Tax=Phreatobacter sp. AB_2022a TaxID=3003134 RepID=UPI002286DCD2|nr:ABC transporter ATP-binding protein [Phreatobacter sp. AB_2022a]MCZ0737571.1 ABC transporter ATP-binding protein [Phreatobacter sp. AB_2022a]
MTALLAIESLSVAYGHVEAVSGVSLGVDAGEIVTVIGANGAGKSTLLNAALGLLPAAQGTVRFDGRDMAAVEAEDRVGLGLCLVAEKRELFGTMTVEDNLVLGGFRTERRLAAETLGAVFDRFPRLKERRGQLAGTLSGGERQMLAMGRALMSRPRLLMLDEPSLGLAPKIVADIFAIIADLRASGVAILLVEQNARAALNAADRGYVMELGRISIEGTSATLAGDPRIAASYLGVGHG